MSWKDEYDSLKFQEANMHTLTIQLTTDQDDERPVYLTGNFNDWKPQDSTYQMRKTGDKTYEFSFDAEQELPPSLQYKFVKGNWDDLEVDEYGWGTESRSLKTNNIQTSNNHVPRWKKKGIAHNPQFLPQIEMITEGEDIPQLRRKRKIWALLPHDYHQSEKRYPVIYLQDAQNLFDKNAPYGNWAIDKSLAVLAEKSQCKVIVIAVEHAGEDRIQDFNPTTKEDREQEGLKYIKFIGNYLKPYIDKKYRTLSDQEHTGIGGSSLAGLVSLYAILQRSDVFSKAMVFSPSLWIAPAVYLDATTFQPQVPCQIYLYGGNKESQYMLSNLQRLKGSFDWKHETKEHLEVELTTDPDGLHNEVRWGKEFPQALEWLFDLA